MVAITKKIQEHYDKVSPFYKKLWGNHIHHGYWIKGDESREAATENLIKLVVEKSKLKPQSKVLDVGCGIGGTSIWLTQKLDCKVTGITISPVQVDMANDAALSLKKKPTFIVMDANNITLKKSYDSVFAIEMISHLPNREAFFKNISRLLNTNGTFCLIDWMKDSNLSEKQERKYIDPIEEGMLVTLANPEDYIRLLEKNNLRVIYYEDINDEVKKTWDICIEIIKNKSFWSLAIKNGPEFVKFLKAFKAMRDGFSTGTFRYVVIVAEKRR